MSSSVARTVVRRLAWTAAVVAALSGGIAAESEAQGNAIASATPARFSIEDLSAQWASLERPLLGVTDLTDLQRDAIELLEEKHRGLFFNEAIPIRDAREKLLMNSQNFPRQQVERALDRISSLRKKQLQLLRGILTDAQRVKFDENLKVLEVEEAAARLRRERDEAFYTP
jgi:Spy/CpxP family protein refolding chaperone